MWMLPQFSQTVALQYYFVVIFNHYFAFNAHPFKPLSLTPPSFSTPVPTSMHLISSLTKLTSSRFGCDTLTVRWDYSPWDDGGAKPSPVCWLLYCATEEEAPWNTWRWVSIHLVLLGCSDICHRKPTERLPRSWHWGGKKAFVESVLLFFFAGGWLIIISHPWQLWHAGRQNKKKISILFGMGNISSTFQCHHVKNMHALTSHSTPNYVHYSFVFR